MKRWIVIGVVLASAIVIIGWLLFGRKAKDTIEVVKGPVTKGELVLKVSARGRIEAKDRYELKAKVSGAITFWMDKGCLTNLRLCHKKRAKGRLLDCSGTTALYGCLLRFIYSQV
ncbi:MAG: hypothetical protein QME07_03125 [bacterium]|nr:hypothetical protein [bacterium]